MAEKIAVDSGNPYRDSSGHFGESPNKALEASFAALRGKKFVPKEVNDKAVKSASKDAEKMLTQLREGKPVSKKNILKEDDITSSIQKARGIDPEQATEEDEQFLKDVQEEAQKALDEDKYPEKRIQLKVLIGDAEGKLKKIGEAKDEKEAAEKTANMVNSLFDELGIPEADREKINKDQENLNLYSFDSLASREDSDPIDIKKSIERMAQHSKALDEAEKEGLLSRDKGASAQETIEYADDQLISRAGPIKSAGARGVFFYMGEDDGNNGYEQSWTERTGEEVKAKNYKLKPGLKILRAHTRTDAGKAFNPDATDKANRSNNDQYAVEQVVARELKKAGYDGVYYDGYAPFSDQGGELTIFNPKNIISLDEKEKQSFGMGIQKANNTNISPDEQRQIDLAIVQFKQSVERVDNQVLAQYIQAIQDGDYAKAKAILENAQESQQQHTLAFALLTIAVILVPIYAKQRLQKLFTQFGLKAIFAQTDSMQSSMKEQAEKGAASHIQTVAKDLMKGLDNAIEQQLTNPDVEAAVKEKYPKLAQKDGDAYTAAVKDDEAIYSFAREQILKGSTKQEVAKSLQETFAQINNSRAQFIASNEANRIFTMSQFDADQQFLAQNGLEKQAFKRLVSNTGTPEAVCAAIIAKTTVKPIPFTQDFLPFNKVFSVTEGGKTYKIKPGYEHLKAGHIHPNCQCRYELLIKRADGTFMNTFTGKIENLFQEEEHPRWPKGTPKGGKFMKMGDINVDKHVGVVMEHMAALQKAHDNLDWAHSGFGDVEEAKIQVEQVKDAMASVYIKALKDNGYTMDDYAKLKRDQLDYSAGGGVRGKDGAYITPPALQKRTGPAMVHQKLTQQVLLKSNTHINLYRGQKQEFNAEPSGIVSYSVTKAIAGDFGVAKQKMVDVNDIRYHYLLDFESVHPTENEVIVQQ